MPSSVSIIVYNQSNLVTWQQESLTIQARFKETLQKIEQQQHSLRLLQSQLNNLDTSISITETQLRIAKVNESQYLMLQPNAHHIHHHASRDTLLNSYNLQYELNDLIAKRASLLSQIASQQSWLKTEKENYLALDSRIAWLQEHIPAAELFLNKLKSNPIELVSSLHNKLIEFFDNYKNNHFLNLSPEVRASLISAQFGLNYLMEIPRLPTPGGPDLFFKTVYLKLTGFLWDCYNRVKMEAKDSDFEEILVKLLENTHVSEHGDLPDNLRTNLTSTQWFNDEKNTYPQYFAISSEKLPTVELKIYTSALDFFKNPDLKLNSTLEKSISTTVKSIELEIDEKKKKEQMIDYYFYSRLLNNLREIFVNPCNNQATANLAKIADYVVGNPSFGKKLLGGLIVVLGLALIAASIAAFITSFGASSILTTTCMGLGLNLLEAHFAIGFASALIGAAGLAITFLAGPKVIKSGMRDGLSAELLEITESVNTLKVQI